MKKTYQELNQPPIQVWYTDNCCHDRGFICSHFDELKKNQAGIEILPIHDYQIMYLKNSIEMVKILMEIEILLNRAQHQIPFGFDIEWPTRANRSKSGNVASMQLCISSTVYLFHIALLNDDQTEDVMGQFKKIILHPHFLPVGSMVKNDIQHINKDFNLEMNVELIEVGSLQSMATRAKVPMPHGLLDLSQKIIGYSLNKDDAIRW